MTFKNAFVKYSICTVMLMSFVLFCPSENVVYASAPDTVQIMQTAGTQITRAEVTEWQYQNVDGKLQRRLWSVTYGVWRTDWEWV